MFTKYTLMASRALEWIRLPASAEWPAVSFISLPEFGQTLEARD